MTLEAFYFAAQILAALAVVGSLLFVGIQIKGAEGISVLSPQELLAFGAYMALWVDSAQRIQAQQDSGYLEINNWHDAQARYKPVTRKVGAFQWWQRARRGYNANLVSIVDGLFADAGHTFPEEGA